MNWVGGSRHRIGLRTERKVQKEYFEKKRQNRKMNNFRSPNKKHGVSQDLIALHTLNAAYPGFLKEKTNQTKKLIRKVDIDKGKHQVQRFQEIELPHSPIETPSKLSLEDATSWNINPRFMQMSKRNTHSRISTEDDSIRSIREVYNKKGLMPVDYSETDYSYATDHSISETYSSPSTQLSGFAVVPTLCKNELMEPIESSESSFTEGTQHYWENSEFQNTSPRSKYTSPFITTLHQIKMSNKYSHSNGSLSPLSPAQQVSYPVSTIGRPFRPTAQLARTKKEIAINNFTELPHSQLLKSIQQTNEFWQIPVFENHTKETSCNEDQDKTEPEYCRRCETKLDSSIKDKQHMDSCIIPSNAPENPTVSQFYTNSLTCQIVSQSKFSEEVFNKVKPLFLEIDSNMMSLSPVNSYIPITEVEHKDTEKDGRYNFLSTPQPSDKITERLQLNETSPDPQLPREKTDQTEVNYENQCSSEFKAKSQENEYLTPLSSPPINAQTQTDFQQNVVDASTSPIVFPQTDQMIQCDIINSHTESQKQLHNNLF
ncbi:uncharacterized protein LOC106871170 isoform X2 [Octopus bimaculoides]|uniref:uncharacterized protein LOC106871170 isoform X2 n=1 Tax=Octopus bimaculoides TaxID=37653 RepID=UPI00071E038C|nr:uncharacterized protein LOC106871170 isoform X2 [Octopus bimaculoides]|eukprot:XP_014772985.1 PREDICTED: uncharacterized protein LOC106871170 isoform X2 [Octopus bimaculoides]